MDFIKNLSNKTLILLLILLVIIIYIIFYKREYLDNNITATPTQPSIQNISVQAVSETPQNISVQAVSETPTATAVIVKNALYNCLSEDTLNKIQSNNDYLKNSNQSINYDNKFDNIIKLALNFDNYNIIKNQIEIFKNLSDDQIVCLLERNNSNFCNALNIDISRDNTTKIEYGLKSIHEILNLYQNQILDVKNIILPRLLLVINKCTNLTKENKIKILNIFKHSLYTAEYISYFLGNNWDLIKKIDDTIKIIN